MTPSLRMRAGTTVIVAMAYAENFLERERLPETFIFIEGTKGSLELAPDYWVRVTTKEGTHARRYPPQRYPWVDPQYEVVQSSIVPCNAHLLGALNGRWPAEMTGEDNLETMRLVFAAYDSAESGRAVHF